MADGEFDLDDFLPYRLNRAAEAVSRRFARIYRSEHGMTRPEWRVLANLGQHGRQTARQICDRAAMHKTEVSRAVARLHARRWLSRTRNPENRREEFLELTRAGKAAFRGLAGHALASDDALVRLLGEEEATALRRGLAAVERALLE